MKEIILKSNLKIININKPGKKWIKLPVLKHLKIKPDKSHRKNYYSWLILLLVSIALSQPVTKDKIPLKTEKIQDIFFIIDISVGMAIQDYQIGSDPIDRLTYVKILLIDYVKKITNNRTGIMVYADDAYILSPLSGDSRLTQYNIRRIKSAIAGRRNNLTKALKTYYTYSENFTSQPAVVILSQGANLEQASDLSNIIVKFKQRNTHLHFIGTGSHTQTDNSSSNLIFDAIDNKILKSISVKSGGQFFWAGKQGELEKAFEAITHAEKTELPTKYQYRIKHYYHWVLYLILLFTIIHYIHFKITQYKINIAGKFSFSGKNHD